MKFSTTTSQFLAIFRTSSAPSGRAKSMAADFFLDWHSGNKRRRVRHPRRATAVPNAAYRRRAGRSILITSAPRSASSCVHQGPASTREVEDADPGERLQVTASACSTAIEHRLRSVVAGSTGHSPPGCAPDPHK